MRLQRERTAPLKLPSKEEQRFEQHLIDLHGPSPPIWGEVAGHRAPPTRPLHTSLHKFHWCSESSSGTVPAAPPDLFGAVSASSGSVQAVPPDLFGAVSASSGSVPAVPAVPVSCGVKRLASSAQLGDDNQVAIRQGDALGSALDSSFHQKVAQEVARQLKPVIKEEVSQEVARQLKAQGMAQQWKDY